MPAIEFEFPQSPAPLVVTWRGLYQDIEIRLGQTALGKVHAVEELLQGHELKLPDGRRLRLKYELTADGPGLRARLEGQPLARTQASARRGLRPAFWALVFVSGQAILLGLTMLFLDVRPFGAAAFGPLALFSGLLYAGLAVGIRRASLTALYIALGYYLLEAVVSIGLGLVGGQPPSFVSLFVRLLILGLLYTAHEPLLQLNGKAAAEPTPGT